MSVTPEIPFSVDQLRSECVTSCYPNQNPTANPSSVRQWLIWHKIAAYDVRTQIERQTEAQLDLVSLPRPNTESPSPNALWCFDRMGQSCTALPDGRKIYIAGEHEDYYDPDFCIYNDVTVVHPDGRIDLYEYPVSDFPPTDFHAAILNEAEQTIITVGSLGYPENRSEATTQVMILDLKTMKIQQQTTLGNAPDWLHGAQMNWCIDGYTLTISNGSLGIGQAKPCRKNLSIWHLNTHTWQWSCPEQPLFEQYLLMRTDKHDLHLWEYGRLFWAQQNSPDYSTELGRLTNVLGIVPLTNIYQKLFQPDIPHRLIEKNLEDANTQWSVTEIMIDQHLVRYFDEGYGVELIIPADLDHNIAQYLIKDLQAKLSKLENTEINCMRF